MQNAIAIIENANNGLTVTMNAKGKQGTFARAIAFASRDARIALGQAMHLKWLQNGQYRPLVNDILSCGLVPKAAIPFVSGLIPTNGSVPKEQFIALCQAVKHAVDNKTNKAGERVEVKGEKAFIFGIVNAIVADANPTTVDA